MFSATKFVVAGVIVALFGGFLLAGVLTQQQSQESVPAVGATASASRAADPTSEGTAAPEALVSDDLVPGVALVTEEVEPGVLRVVSDGFRALSREGLGFDGDDGADGDGGVLNLHIKVGPHGSVWILGPHESFQVGEQPSYPSYGPGAFWIRDEVKVAPDGTLWALDEQWPGLPSGTLRQSSDGSWIERFEDVSAFDIAPDGTIWAEGRGVNRSRPLEGEDPAPAGWRRVGPDRGSGTIRELAIRPIAHPLAKGEEHVDYQVWLRSHDGDLRPEDAVLEQVLISPAGTADSAEHGDFPGGPMAMPPGLAGPFDVGSDGTMWLYQYVDLPVPGRQSGGGDEPASEHLPFLIRVDPAGSMTTFGAEDGVPQMIGLYHEGFRGNFEGPLEVAPAGSVWLSPTSERRFGMGDGDCDGLARFDGVTWTRYLRDACIYAVDTAADGTLWVQAGEWLRTDDEYPPPGAVHTYAITPEAVAATE